MSTNNARNANMKIKHRRIKIQCYLLESNLLLKIVRGEHKKEMHYKESRYVEGII